MKPKGLIVPTLELPPGTPPTLQATAPFVRVWVEPSVNFLVAENTREVFSGTVARARKLGT